MLPSKCGGFGGVNEAKRDWGGGEGRGGLEGMHWLLLFGCRCVIPINLKAGMRGVSRREGEEAFLWQEVKSTPQTVMEMALLVSLRSSGFM